MTSQASMSPSPWCWAVEDEEPKTGPEEELIRQLATGRLPPYTLVWRAGWGEWLPAMQVEDLAEAFPEARALGTRTARPSSVPGGIPPVPVSEYPRLRHLAKVAPLGWPDGFDGPEQEIITSEVPAAALIEAARAMTQPSPPRDLGLQEAIERASRAPHELASFGVFDEEGASPPSRPARPLAAEFGLEGLIEEAAPRRSGSSWLLAHGLWIAVAALTLGLGLTFAIRNWGSVLAARTPARAASSPGRVPGDSPSAPTAHAVEPRVMPAAAVEPAPPAVELGCRIRHPAVSIDDWAVVDVRPHIASQPGGGSVVIGYAQSHKSATGGLLNVESLELSRRYWQQEERQIVSVTPLAGAGAKPVYHAERLGSSVAFGRVLDTTPPMRLGINDDGVVIGRLDQRLRRLWELPPGSRITVPEVVTHARGFTIATRTGRGPGRVRVGSLDALGSPSSELAEVGPAGWDFGRPALASGFEQTVLTVTRRASADLPDEILLARAENGQLPTELQPFEVPSGVDRELLAPVIAALPDGGFVLMWSQGSGARRIVRVQRLSDSLEPRGSPLELTSPDPALGGAISAALYWAGDRLLSFYFLRREEGHSLWVCSLTCGS